MIIKDPLNVLWTIMKPESARILGSGLRDYAGGIKIEDAVDYTEIKGFPVSTVTGHKEHFDTKRSGKL